MPDPIIALASLDRALDSVIEALTSGSPESLVATEAGLTAAIADVSRIVSVSAEDRPRLLAGLAHTRETLNRCRLVGTAVAGIIDGCLAARGLSNTYNRSGKHSGQ